MPLRTFAAALAAALLVLLSGPAAVAAPAPKPRVVSALLLSDLHFDPFQDPAKLEALRVSDIRVWDRVFDEPASTTQAADFAALQKTCHARGVDSSWGVLHGSLQAAAATRSAPLFITVSGDLLTHGFDCRLRTLAPSVSPEALADFAAKTIAFLALQLRQTFPGIPVYLALGNNDSGCSNYHQTAGSDFLHIATETIATDAAAGITHNALQFDPEGDYSVALPSPMRHARLIVLQDVFESVDFQDCTGEKAEASATGQLTWLRAQLAAARASNEHVWVMAHIPPGVDAFASFHKYIATPARLCQGTAPTRMLRSEVLNATLTEFADVVRFALFGHTHMDEIKLLHNDLGRTVPAKLVPSISPVNGNHPAFTVAEVRPATAVLADYTVYVANSLDATGWAPEYRFSEAYGVPQFSADTVLQLTSTLANDKAGTEPLSQTYRHWFFAGDTGDYAHGLAQIWPSYACGTLENAGPAFTRCMCPSGTVPAAPAGSHP